MPPIRAVIDVRSGQRAAHPESAMAVGSGMLPRQGGGNQQSYHDLAKMMPRHTEDSEREAVR
jgi:hypothetical protein